MIIATLNMWVGTDLGHEVFLSRCNDSMSTTYHDLFGSHSAKWWFYATQTWQGATIRDRPDSNL